MQFTTLLLRSLFAVASIVSGVTAQWQITELSTHEMTDTSVVKFNSTVDFSIVRPGKTSTLCSTQWVHWPSPIIPKQWIQCQNDPLLRFRVAAFNDVSNYTLEVVQVDPVKTTGGKTTAIGVTRANITVSTDIGIHCSGQNTDAGTQYILSNPPLNLTTSSSTFTPIALPIFFSESRSGGVIKPCNDDWTFQMYDPNVATLGSVTLSGAPQYWQTTCKTSWACSNTDPSITNWTSCAAPSFQFKKTIPTGGDSVSNFKLSIKHTFPLLMATSIRGSNASDIGLKDPEEAPGLQAVLTLQEEWEYFDAGASQ